MGKQHDSEGKAKVGDVLEARDQHLPRGGVEGTDEAGFSPDGRSSLFRGISSPVAPSGGFRRLEALFSPLARWAAFGAVPVVASAVVASWLLFAGPGAVPTAPEIADVSVSALKVGDRVVFTIGNGGRSHRVVRTSSPASISGPGETMAVEDGTFSDCLQDGSDLVFYRID